MMAQGDQKNADIIHHATGGYQEEEGGHSMPGVVICAIYFTTAQVGRPLDVP